jgi:hypothetical protein
VCCKVTKAGAHTFCLVIAVRYGSDRANILVTRTYLGNMLDELCNHYSFCMSSQLKLRTKNRKL